VNSRINSAQRNRPDALGRKVPEPFAAITEFGIDAGHVGRLAVEAIQRGDLYVAVAPDHRLAQQAGVAMTDLRDEAWVAFPLAHPGRLWLDRACDRAGFRPRILTEVGSLAQLKTFVEAGTGIAMLPARAASSEQTLGALTLLPIAEPTPRVSVGLIYDADFITPAANAVREALHAVARDHAVSE
jgi:DNA-binding transcriptional LysR family regulator